MKREEIIEFYVMGIMQGKITIEDVKEEYKEEVEKALERAVYNECFEDSQY